MLAEKNKSHRRQRAVLAAALLLALSALCAWFGDGSDSLTRRSLLAVPVPFLINRARLMAAPGCRGVLLTSQGGVGSSAFLTAIEAVQTPGYPFYTNDHKDADGLKHQPASRWTDHDATGIRRTDRETGNELCFAKVLVVVGDPVHTIESTHRRFGMGHVNKLKQRSGLGNYPRSMPLRYLYDDVAHKGSDTTGITQYIAGWYEASRDRDHWPEVRMVTARTLLDRAEDHARWIGVEERDLYIFRNMKFDAGLQHRTAPSASSAFAADGAMEVFAEAIGIVNAIDELPYGYGEGGGLDEGPPNHLVDAVDELPYDRGARPGEGGPPPTSKQDRRLAEQSARQARASKKALRDRQKFFRDNDLATPIDVPALLKRDRRLAEQSARQARASKRALRDRQKFFRDNDPATPIDVPALLKRDRRLAEQSARQARASKRVLRDHQKFFRDNDPALFE